MTFEDQLAQDLAIIESVARAALPRAQRVGMNLDDLRSIGHDVLAFETGYGKPLHGAALKQRTWDRVKRGIAKWAETNRRYGTPLKEIDDGKSIDFSRAPSINPRPGTLSPRDVEAMGDCQVMAFAMCCKHHPRYSPDAEDRQSSRERVKNRQMVATRLAA